VGSMSVVRVDARMRTIAIAAGSPVTLDRTLGRSGAQRPIGNWDSPSLAGIRRPDVDRIIRGDVGYAADTARFFGGFVVGLPGYDPDRIQRLIDLESGSGQIFGNLGYWAVDGGRYYPCPVLCCLAVRFLFLCHDISVLMNAHRTNSALADCTPANSSLIT
jgi:hypothetical protein